MKRIGLEPGNPDGTYFQTVKMVAQNVDPATSSLKIAGPSKTWDLKLGPDAVFLTKDQKNKTVSFTDSDLILVGYGVVAPEASWNDYAAIDVKGKTVVMFVNDPGFITNDNTLFNGQAMTYYGRWTYKFEEAARQGADLADEAAGHRRGVAEAQGHQLEDRAVARAHGAHGAAFGRRGNAQEDRAQHQEDQPLSLIHISEPTRPY